MKASELFVRSLENDEIAYIEIKTNDVVSRHAVHESRNKVTRRNPEFAGGTQRQTDPSADAGSAKKLGLLSRIHTFDSLSIRDYRLLWLGQLDTSMGQWMDSITRGYLIYHITSSPLQLGLAAAMRGIPLFLFGIVAGALADRSGRKAQLIVAQVTNAALNLILATLVLTNRVQPWHVYVTGFLVGTVQAFQNPARQILVSDLAGRRHLMNALALNSMAVNSSRAVGPAFAGLLIATIGVHGSYYVQAAMFLLATVWTIQMHIPERSRESVRVARESLFQSIKGGFGYVRANSQYSHPVDPGARPAHSRHALYQHDADLRERCFTWRRPASRFITERLWRWLIAGRVGRGFHSAPKRLRPAGGHWRCGFQYLGILLWLVALGLVVLDVRFHQRRFYDDLPDPGPGVAAAQCAATYPRPRDEFLSHQPRDRPDRHTVAPAPLLITSAAPPPFK